MNETPPALPAAMGPGVVAERPFCGESVELPDGSGTLICAKPPHEGLWHRDGKTTWKVAVTFGGRGHRRAPRP